MVRIVEILIFLALVYNGWQLNQIRKISRACYIELNTTRWENGLLVRAQDKGQGLSAVSGQSKDLPV